MAREALQLPLDELAALADEADRSADWPVGWDILQRSGVLAWSVPTDFGGEGRSATDLLDAYEQLSGACLTTAFILSQREAGIRRLIASNNPDLKLRYLPRLSRGELMLTVGLSQLTTSRPHRGPALVAESIGRNAHQINGVIPWVTAADRTDAVLTGARRPDGLQVLFLLPVNKAGVTIEPPLELAALQGSRTAEIRCDAVEIGDDLLAAGPAERVLSGPGGGGVETSALALGLAGAATDWLHAESIKRSELKQIAEGFDSSRHAARQRLIALTTPGAGEDAILAARVACTRLALNATQVALTVAKGTGFVVPHPTQRWARQALFFLVWSCPRPVTEGLLAELAPDDSNSKKHEH